MASRSMLRTVHPAISDHVLRGPLGDGARTAGQKEGHEADATACDAAAIGGLVDVGETYTAVYERDGETWVAEIAEEPRVQSRGPSVAEVRESIRDALSRWLQADSGELDIVDHFRM